MVKRRRKAPTEHTRPEVRQAMQPKRSVTSRRGFFGGLIAGFHAPDTVPLSQQARSGAAAALRPMFDYARAPFPQRSQEWAELGGGMTLKPRSSDAQSSDHGTGRLIGRRALVTAGDTGMGRAAAIAFARQGADVAFTFLPAERSDAEDVARLVRQAGRKAVLLPGDLHDEECCHQVVASAVSALGGIDILVSNAARQQSVADIAEMSTEQFDAGFKSNIYAMFWLTKAALPHMGPGSSIINTSSVESCEPSDILLDYSATKGAIMVFTKSLAKQLASRGIRVNAVAPGPIWTPRASSDDPTSDDPGAEQPTKLGADTCWAGGAHQAELASTYVLLASSESSYATGQLYGAVGGSSP
jgi:NAD(P)-dependent dehydrogenase (short-subunit alcohol dehydrogenase family)